jgi:hypothetical protein
MLTFLLDLREPASDQSKGNRQLDDQGVSNHLSVLKRAI